MKYYQRDCETGEIVKEFNLGESNFGSELAEDQLNHIC